MDIIPDKKKFIHLAASSTRIPVLGEERIIDLDPFQLFKILYKNSNQSFLLESGKGPIETAHYSFFGASNSKLLQFYGSKARLYENNVLKTEFKNTNEAFKLLDFDKTTRQVDYLHHFWGGWIGYIGYEAGTLFENIKLQSSHQLPSLSFMEVDRLFIYDHKTKKLKFILSGKNKIKDADYEEFFWEIKGVWKDIYRVLETIRKSTKDQNKKSICSKNLSSTSKKSDYLNQVEKAKKYINDGDIYQANLSQKFEVALDENPLNIYQRLRRVNPSPFSGFLKINDLCIASSSPERLIKVKNDTIESRPIAGTRPRSNDKKEDNALANELLLNDKECAEHLMLVDLERNDLGRICKNGTVQVTDFMLLEQYSHVSHIVSNISGNLLSAKSVFDILKAVFPGGTITGCPKIRCMEIINELEPVERGPYSGSFGYIGYTPYLDFNIIIRSILIHNGKASFHVGAGIVADSIPEKEYQETLDKAAAMMEALFNGN